MENILTGLGRIGRSGLGVPILLIALLSMMVLPMPPVLLDLFFTFNITLSLVVILAGVYAKKPLDFAVFPTILLLATLIRLALNVASTRVVLLDGHTGTGAAGNVIESFGNFVAGGNYTVGLVVFIVLVIINFIVVTKGAGRISEVSARFTLDAMPGKQMAIDADFNAGLLTQEEAKERREEIVREADFYGSMDGASKFVRGDAIAGILILVINIVGGLIIGVAQHDMAFSDAMHNYTLLTIGDGLVAQIPSLVLSTAAALMVTRVSSSQDMGAQILSQLFSDPRSLLIPGAVLGALGLIPGMPNMAFLGLAALCGLGAYYISKNKPAMSRETIAAPSVQSGTQELIPADGENTAGRALIESQEPKELSWDDVVPVDIIGLEVGYKLIPLVDKKQGGQLMHRIKGVRKKLTQELGFLIPSVHIRDNLELSPSSYRISVMGVIMGEVQIHVDRDMAINPGQVFGTIEGIPGKDPAFGLDAVWIDPAQKDQAQTLGYTVVDASTVVATHVSDILQKQAAQLLGREEVQLLLDNLSKTMPKLVEELPDIIPPTIILRVLQNLLNENIPIRDMRSIAETLAEQGAKGQDPAILTAAVRVALGRMIVQKINGIEQELPVIVLDPELEHILHDAIQTGGESGAGLEPGLAEKLQTSLMECTQRQEAEGKSAVLLVSAPLRPMLARFVRFAIQTLSVLSYNEIPDDKTVKVVASVGK
ncbi:MAG: flagellar biosynthesis protein FlhA [Gammaproteobacteria bacterium]|nr:flagellar biosynthesis protein FlhA [Gammaproteobacteria bacterium]